MRAGDEENIGFPCAGKVIGEGVVEGVVETLD